MHFALALILVGLTPELETELVFPLDPQHNHAPGIVEYPSGDLLVSWYRGSGERSADDVAVYGAIKTTDSATWSSAFIMADEPGFPDCNTCMMIDPQGQLWLFWPTILANSWESCLTNYQVATRFDGLAEPEWSRRGVILLRPENFAEQASASLDELLETIPPPLQLLRKKELDEMRQRMHDKLYQRVGWQPRCKPTVLPSGRILLPLYSDTFSASIMAISDDQGKTWTASQPLLGWGNIQPTVLRRDDGKLLAYMRENGPRDRVRVAESKDEGMTWGPVGITDFPNPGSGLDGVRLANGHWLLVYNDTVQGRSSLAVSISDDEGQTWKWTRHLEQQSTGSYHYPACIQGRDGRIHVVYSYFVAEGKSMKHAAFHEDWIVAGE